MCTKKDVDQFWRKHNFSAVAKINEPKDIDAFYIPPEHKELQYAAYNLLGKFCMGWPRQFPKLSYGSNMINDWRESGYYFCFGPAHCFDSIKVEFRGFSHLANFTKHPIINRNKFSVTRIATSEHLISHLTQTKETEMPIIEQIKATKTKTRLAPRLVFTYTNGATYTVRGLEKAQVANMYVNYFASTVDAEGNATVTEVKRRITNEFETVVIELPNGGKRVLLDLRADRTKKIEKPPRKHKSREEYEAERAQKEAEKAKLAKVEELLDEAAKLMK